VKALKLTTTGSYTWPAPFLLRANHLRHYLGQLEREPPVEHLCRLCGIAKRAHDVARSHQRSVVVHVIAAAGALSGVVGDYSEALPRSLIIVEGYRVMALRWADAPEHDTLQWYRLTATTAEIG
jgi:hypothetical protein